MITAVAVGAVAGVVVLAAAFAVVVVYGPGIDAAHYGFCA